MFLLFIICLVIFSVIGSNLAGDIMYNNFQSSFVNVNEYFSLDNFYTAFLINFRLAGENWPYIMQEYSTVEPDDLQAWSVYLYFILSNFLCYVVLVNLFLLIVLQEYYTFQQKGENPLEKFEILHEQFTKSWNKYSENDFKGYKITINNFYKFLFDIEWEFSSKLLMNGKMSVKSVNKYLLKLNIKK